MENNRGGRVGEIESISIYEGIARYQQIGPQVTGFQELYYVIDGLKGTIFEGCKFQLQVILSTAISIDKRSEFHTEHPPTVRFLTVPYHPNIDWFSGRPCVEGLLTRLGWRQWFNQSIDNLALYLQWLLSNPTLEPDPPVNSDAARMLAAAPEEYLKMVGKCTAESRRMFYRYQRTAEREAKEQAELVAANQAQVRADEVERRKQYDQETMKTVKKQAYYLMYGLFKDFGRKREEPKQSKRQKRNAIDIAQLTRRVWEAAEVKRRQTAAPPTADGIRVPAPSTGDRTEMQSLAIVNVTSMMRLENESPEGGLFSAEHQVPPGSRQAIEPPTGTSITEGTDNQTLLGQDGEEDEELKLIKWSQTLPIEST